MTKIKSEVEISAQAGWSWDEDDEELIKRATQKDAEYLEEYRRQVTEALEAELGANDEETDYCMIDVDVDIGLVEE